MFLIVTFIGNAQGYIHVCVKAFFSVHSLRVQASFKFLRGNYQNSTIYKAGCKNLSLRARIIRKIIYKSSRYLLRLFRIFEKRNGIFN